MTALSADGLICAKRGGPSFIDTIRVEPVTQKCPKGHVPCSPHSSASETVCIAQGQEYDCPIIDLLFIQEDMVSSMQDLGYTIVKSPSRYIAFSKTLGHTDSDNINPFIGSAINTQQPCYGLDKHRLIIDESSIDFTLEKNNPINACEENEWRKATIENDD